MRSVYKYLPREFVPALLEGRILFRNLVYFKRLERDTRWDVFEGGHIDAPDHDVHMDNLTTGKRITGPFVFHNTLEYPDRVFCFCTSLSLSLEMRKYGTACVEIVDVDAFSRRIELQLTRYGRIVRLGRPILQARPIVYYDQTKAAPEWINIKNPRDLPFVKRTKFSSDQEFRFVFARRRAYELKQVVHMDRREIDEGIETKPSKDTIVEIGSIRDIAREVS